MQTPTKQLLSGSANGKQILVTATTNGTAQTIHTAVAGTASLDEVWLYAYNDGTGAVVLSTLWGGTLEPDNVTRYAVQPQAGRTLLIDGALLQNGLLIKVYAGTGSKLTLDGFVNNIT